jgi:hypothetical protein
MDSGIFISRQVFSTFSSATQAEVLQGVTGAGQASQATSATTLHAEDDGPADLTPALARRFMNGVSAKTEKLIGVIVSNEGRASFSTLLKETGDTHWRKLAGFQAGVTKRARNLLDDDDAYLLACDNEIYNDEDELLDAELYLSPMTLQAFKKYFAS